MTIKELQVLKKVIEHIKNPDGNVIKALAYINKDLAIYEARKGQLREQVEYDYSGWGQ